jgi:peptidoglycan L-alanyl-D-glutamate endopeptidase CwlK
MSRDLEDLTPETHEKCLRFLDECEDRGIAVMIVETLRTRATQEVYYMQGRHPLKIVNMARRKVGLWPLLEEENKRRITWTLESNHFTGEAFDVALVKDGRPTWNIKTDMNGNEIQDYDEIGLIGESVGLTWGGRFKNSKGKPRPDRPHFQNQEAA